MVGMARCDCQRRLACVVIFWGKVEEILMERWNDSNSSRISLEKMGHDGKRNGTV